MTVVLMQHEGRPVESFPCQLLVFFVPVEKKGTENSLTFIHKPTGHASRTRLWVFVFGDET